GGAVTFTEIAAAAGVADPGMGWGTAFFDADNDGWQDLYIANDSYFSPAPNVLFHNLSDTTFQNASTGTPLASMQPGYGFACTDFNNDGKMDIYLANYGGTTGNEFFKNNSANSNNWLKIKLTGKVSNRAAIGSRVTVEAGGVVQVDDVTGGSGYCSQNSLTLHFGLGQAQVVDKLTIRWANGLVEEFENLAVNQTWLAVEGESLLPASCADQFAGTISFSNFIGQSNDISLDTIFLCFNDQIGIQHNGDANLTGDPNPLTTPGIAYSFFDCPPNVSGFNLTSIVADTCVTNFPPPATGIWVTAGGTANGNITFNNSGTLQNFFNAGAPVQLWFAPITVDNFAIKQWEADPGSGEVGACV
ncbi:MAG: CRTAC1 family protein, partial [Bacteroidota bacterium]